MVLVVGVLMVFMDGLKEEEKYKTWDLIRHLYRESTLLILFIDDFNEILSFGEKEGGVDRPGPTMLSFRDVIDDLSL